MTRLPNIWEVLLKFDRGKWSSVSDLYNCVSNHCSLDSEDDVPQCPGSKVPKWKRNVRNVLQYRKKMGQILWDQNTHAYLIL